MTVQGYLEDFGALSTDGHPSGPAWLAALRQQGIAEFDRQGFPTTRDEDWHFTSTSAISEADFRTLRAPGGEVDANSLTPFLFEGDAWPRLVFVNGRYSADLSDVSTLPAGVSVRDLGDAMHDDEALVQRYLGQLAPPTRDGFTALNSAFAYDGAVVHFGRESVSDLPVHLVFVNDALAAAGASHPRNLIVAERSSRGTVIESYVALGEATYFTNAVTEIVVEEGAHLTHLKVQRESSRSFHVGTIEARQARDSHFVSFSFATGASLARTNVFTVLGGPGAGATLNGLYMVNGQQHVDHQTRIEHAEPDCFSRELYKGVLDGASHGVFNGKVYVRPVAQKTDGKQSNNNLLLSPHARVDTKPQLEIFADDVKCTHGATIGRIDETALFYMKSRGINAPAARQLLTYAFAADVLETIENNAVKQQLEKFTLARFTGTDGSQFPG